MNVYGVQQLTLKPSTSTAYKHWYYLYEKLIFGYYLTNSPLNYLTVIWGINITPRTGVSLQHFGPTRWANGLKYKILCNSNSRINSHNKPMLWYSLFFLHNISDPLDANYIVWHKQKMSSPYMAWNFKASSNKFLQSLTNLENHWFLLN